MFALCPVFALPELVFLLSYTFLYDSDENLIMWHR